MRQTDLEYLPENAPADYEAIERTMPKNDMLKFQRLIIKTIPFLSDIQIAEV